MFFAAAPAAYARARGQAPAAHARASSQAAQAGDVAATRSYIEADYRLVRAGRDDLPVVQAAVHTFAQRTVSECPLVGEGAYVNHAANSIGEEIFDTIGVVASHPDAGAIRVAAAAFKRLGWSNGELTRRVHALAVKLENLAAMTPANICVDVEAYAATGFSTVSERTVHFIKLYEAANIESEEVPWRFLTPYEGPHEAKLIGAINRLELPFGEFETHAVGQWMRIMRGLDLSV